MADKLDLLWAQIDAIIAAEDAKTADDKLWADPDICDHPCIHGTIFTGPKCCACGEPIV